ncbi:MAG TPA: sigma-70 family RNA polymerase sigma factor, partial [Solirubrobacterales bacterium]|nr:sigma-70 family RNA polymerase sigma factor [Solirubrobacterales bacterium]
MEASALTRAPARGFLARRSPLLRLESDERLVALIRAGHDGAFEALFNRYNGRLLGFCQSMLKSRQDAEDVLQEVFTNAHAAMLRDDRKINVRPWLYRIARNRCLNHMRRPVPEGQDSMDVLPHGNGTTTAEHVQMREDLRQLLADVETLPETQRTALLLREVDQLSYEEIAQAMQTTVPSVKSLLVRARIGLAESGQARMLTCGEVQVSLAEAAEGLSKLEGPARKHVRGCEGCDAFRDQLRSDRKAMAALFPVGLVALFKGGILAKLFGSGAAGSGAVGSGAGAVGSAGAASGGLGGISLLGGAVGAKAAAGFATAAILTAGAVEVRNMNNGGGESATPQPPAAEVTSPEETSHPALATDPTPPFEDAASLSRDRADDRGEPAPPANPSQPDTEPAASEPAVVPEVAEKPVPVDGEATVTTTDEDEVAVGTPTSDPDTGAAPIDPPPTEPTPSPVTPPAPAP